MRPEWHDVESVLHRVKKRMTPQIKHHELQLLPFTESLEARFDVMMTEQVLQNLIDNAAKYTPAGTPIELGMQVLATGHLAIFVRDYGPGIPEDKREKIFDKYARIEREDSTVAGTGLGLAICKAIMEAQGGSIHLENPLNGGAQFTLLFPEWRPLLATSYEE
jgi:two-component system sensor histidine kinase KdpD